MSSPENPIDPSGAEEISGADRRALATQAGAVRQVSRLFILPAIIVAVIAFCALLAGGLWVLLKESNDPSKYLEQIKAGGGNRRWQAAYELAKVIAATDGEVDDQTARALVEAFHSAETDDPRVGRYLILALGRVKRPESLGALREALEDDDTDTRIYAMWGLGSQGDTAAAPTIARALTDQDAGVRKMAAYALGFLADPETLPALRGALDDRTPDVRWNAALALARVGDPAAEEQLLAMLDRPYLEGLTDVDGNRLLDGERLREVMINGIRGVALLGDQVSPAARERLRELAASEPDLRVRDAAIKALESFAG